MCLRIFSLLNVKNDQITSQLETQVLKSKDELLLMLSPFDQDYFTKTQTMNFVPELIISYSFLYYHKHALGTGDS